MLIGVMTTLLIPEPKRSISNDTWKEEQRVLQFLQNSHNWPEKLRQINA